MLALRVAATSGTRCVARGTPCLELIGPVFNVLPSCFWLAFAAPVSLAFKQRESGALQREGGWVRAHIVS